MRIFLRIDAGEKTMRVLTDRLRKEWPVKVQAPR